MEEPFFKPFVGKDYEEGIKGKRILVYGASFYCNKTGCEFFKDCTSPEKKDSSAYNTKCPEYAKKKDSMELSNEPSYAIEEEYRAYKRFGELMKLYVENKEEFIWDRMAFTDYVQFFLPIVQTKREFLSGRDFDAFKSVIVKLQPHIVVIWGLPVTEEVRDNRGKDMIPDWDKLPESEWYLCHMKIDDVPHLITLVCTYHPSSFTSWGADFEKLHKYMDIALNEKV